MSIQESIKNSLLTANGLVAFSTNQPRQYLDKQRQYLSPETKTFTQTYAKYASDYFEARVQGIDPQDPFAWQTRTIRMADVVRPSAAILRRADNYKMVLFADRDVEYLLPGAKILTAGSSWLVTNPFNISAADGAGIVERCNAVWNYLDYYGNVVSEPMVVSNRRADANDSDAQEANLISKGYFNVAMQYNDVTKQIDTNTRFILGTAAYRVTGYSDFLQEFTGDYESVRILEFTIRFEEANDEIDDMENHVAGGKKFSWDVQIPGAGSIAPGETLKLTATSLRNGEEVTATAEHPVSYRWTSSDETVATVDENGVVTAIADGEAVITAALEQNSAHKSKVALRVAQAQSAVRFTSPVPEKIPAYTDVTLTAAYFDGNSETDEELTWSFEGADKSKFRVMQWAKGCTIYGFGYSKEPLTVTARRGAQSVSVEIALEGI